MNMDIQGKINLAKCSPFCVDDHLFGDLVTFTRPFRNIIQTFEVARIGS